MGVLVLILSTTYTSSLFRPSLAGCIAGFLVNLTHYDSPGSPLYNPNATIYDRMSAQTPLTVDLNWPFIEDHLQDDSHGRTSSPQ
ncbi:hypothetical protein AMTR_s00057p00165070 [Amborella trichopoda]|uniref:Uncharacterized protein n=1 Tax=Amborella trichopoda TaxID=13333 RepID=U5D393_AMBTC|nr:hypothetical protein AMTR_s00057p00165070 [Amborella trichopoda]